MLILSLTENWLRRGRSMKEFCIGILLGIGGRRGRSGPRAARRGRAVILMSGVRLMKRKMAGFCRVGGVGVRMKGFLDRNRILAILS